LTDTDLTEAAFTTLPDLIAGAAASRPHHLALAQDGRALDYAALHALMDRVAASLQRDGIGPGDAIAICAGTSIEYAAVFLGSLRAGVAVAPLAPSSTPESLAVMAADANARLLFLDRRSASCCNRCGNAYAAIASRSTPATRVSHCNNGWRRKAQNRSPS
jgi:long-chain acyl-CoA synthetase